MSASLRNILHTDEKMNRLPLTEAPLKLLTFAGLMISLAAPPALAASDADCADMSLLKFQIGKLPRVQDRDLVFGCIGVADTLKSLDQLDKDLLFYRAQTDDVETFLGRSTQEAPPKKFQMYLDEAKAMSLIEALKALSE